MIRYAIPLLAAAAASVPAAAEVQLQSSGPIVELSINETVSADPDVVDLSAGVTTQAPSAVAAMQQNAQAMTRVVERIEALGIDRDDIQTSGINLNPVYDYDQQTSRQVFRGYQVMNRVNVTLRDIDRTGQVLDALVASGATDLGGLNFRIDDETSARQQARSAAMERAQAEATAYARMAGYTGVRLLEISENVSIAPPRPYAERAAVQSSDASTPVRPGQVDAGVTINVTYEMTR